MKANVEAFFDEATYTISYIVKDPTSSHCVIVDSVLDYDPKSGRTNTSSADRIVDHVRRYDLEVDWILETHAHADHLSAAPYLKKAVGGRTAIGAHIKDVQDIFKKVFNLEKSFATDGSQFGRLLKDGDTFQIGSLTARVMHVPGHTPACVAYVIGDAAFVGDTLFMPDYGTARCDFPGGNARTLYRSIQKLLLLPDETRLFMCHDYKAPGRDDYAWETTVADERNHNVHIHKGVTEDAFVDMRNKRDAGLEMPNLLLPSVQVNIRAGEFPPPEDNGIVYLKIPVNAI